MGANASATVSWPFDSDIPYGGQQAQCDLSTDYNEQSGDWCLKPCPASYTNKGSRACQQTCGGRFPAEGMGGICGTDQGEVAAALTEAALEVAMGAIDIHAMYTHMEENGVDSKSISRTANTLIDMGKPFAKPQCPKDMGQ